MTATTQYFVQQLMLYHWKFVQRGSRRGFHKP
jgi:hypothetical protein